MKSSASTTRNDSVHEIVFLQPMLNQVHRTGKSSHEDIDRQHDTQVSQGGVLEDKSASRDSPECRSFDHVVCVNPESKPTIFC